MLYRLCDNMRVDYAQQVVYLSDKKISKTQQKLILLRKFDITMDLWKYARV